MSPVLSAAEVAPPVVAEDIEVTVVMPCLNEARTVGRCVAKAVKALEELGVRGEVIVADNGSTDDSRVLAAEQGARVVPVAQKGYGSALRGGIAAAKGRFVIMGDSDDSYDMSNLRPFVERLRAGDDLVMGNRFRGGIRPGAMPPLHKYIGNPALTAILRLFFRAPIGDSQCGQRGFRKDSIERLRLNTPGMEFASEMLVKATLNRLKIGEVPIVLHPDGRDRPPHLRSFRDGWRHLRFMLLLCPLWLYLIPAGFLLTGGLGLMAALTPGSLHLGRVTLDVHTMLLGSLCAMLGYQTLWLGFLAKVYGHYSGVLPARKLILKMLKTFTLERGIATGLVVAVIGLVANLGLVWEWIGRDMGPLDASSTLRLAFWGMTALVVGVQTVYSSFFLSMLKMNRL
ncbi:MAG: glycosyltransferase family 2 protein [Gemmataceae bacterium]